jgi:hypothetical protein
MRCRVKYTRPVAVIALAAVTMYLASNQLASVGGLQIARRSAVASTAASTTASAAASSAGSAAASVGIGWNGEDAELLRKLCGAGRTGTFFVQELSFPWDSYLGPPWSAADSARSITPLLSLHNPEVDAVVSKGLLGWLWSAPGTYPSVIEVHTLCTAKVGDGPLVRCEAGRTAVEVGSAIGMVSMYLAERGMRVYALDPVLPNLQRITESICLNGVRHCLQAHRKRGVQPVPAKCINSTQWGRFMPSLITTIHAIAGRSTAGSRFIAAQPQNLAATNPKTIPSNVGRTAQYSANVPIVALDDFLVDAPGDIELLHMCPQGEEMPVLEGAFNLIKAKRVRNILFGIYQMNAGTRNDEIQQSLKIHTFLSNMGFDFYSVEVCGRGGGNGGQPVATGPPVLLKSDAVAAYLKNPRGDGFHSMFLASLPAAAAPQKSERRNVVGGGAFGKTGAIVVDAFARAAAAASAAAEEGLGSEGRRGVAANVAAAAEKKAAAGIIRKTHDILAAATKAEDANILSASVGGLQVVRRSSAGSAAASVGIGWNGEDAELLRKLCGAGRTGTFFVQELSFPWDSYLGPPWSAADSARSITPLLSLHNPEVDAVVSKGLLGWLWSAPGTYPSVIEVHTLCTAKVGDGPLVRCEAGRTAVEVGSAIGMVSMYLAERGMRVYALDPVLPNLQRITESICLNGVRHCLQAHRKRGVQPVPAKCINSTQWGRFMPSLITTIHAIAGRSTAGSRFIAAQPQNLAATNPKTIPSNVGRTAQYSANVPIVALDDFLVDAPGDIELLHMCPQGEEMPVLEGAFNLIKAKRVRNILFGIYQMNAGTRNDEIQQSLKIHTFLSNMGFDFYSVEVCGRGGGNGGQPVATGPPVLLKSDAVAAYLKNPRGDGFHSMFLASLPAAAAPQKSERRNVVGGGAFGKTGAIVVDAFARAAAAASAAAEEGLGSEGRRGVAANVAAAAEKKAAAGIIRKTHDILAAATKAEDPKGSRLSLDSAATGV